MKFLSPSQRRTGDSSKNKPLFEYNEKLGKRFGNKYKDIFKNFNKLDSIEPSEKLTNFKMSLDYLKTRNDKYSKLNIKPFNNTNSILRDNTIKNNLDYSSTSNILNLSKINKFKSRNSLEQLFEVKTDRPNLKISNFRQRINKLKHHF